MYVQLNFSSKSLKRIFREGVHEYSLFDTSLKVERPLTQSEYKDVCTELGLNIAEFCQYQDRLLNQFLGHKRECLNETFEALSTSANLKPQYDDCATDLNSKESTIRLISDKLREKRHEKIRTKGLSDY
jgi:hypothetical protein